MIEMNNIWLTIDTLIDNSKYTHAVKKLNNIYNKLYAIRAIILHLKSNKDRETPSLD